METPEPGHKATLRTVGLRNTSVTPSALSFVSPAQGGTRCTGTLWGSRVHVWGGAESTDVPTVPNTGALGFAGGPGQPAG